MSDVKCARILVEAAERDLSALRGMTDDSVFAHEVFGFHAQQATENLLKAWIALLGKTYPQTHDIAQLLELLKVHGVDVSGYQDMERYSPYAVALRYVAVPRGTNILERSTAIRHIETLFHQLRNRLSAAEAA